MINKKFLKKMKEVLLLQKKELLAKSAEPVDIDTDGDETDEVQANVILELANQLNTRNIAKLAQVNDALHRIEDSSYGLCLDCEENIPEKRLINNPYFLICVACAEERELEEKQRKRS